MQTKVSFLSLKPKYPSPYSSTNPICERLELARDGRLSQKKGCRKDPGGQKAGAQDDLLRIGKICFEKLPQRTPAA